jgi:hypothetical protein
MLLLLLVKMTTTTVNCLSVWVHMVDCGILASYDLDAYVSIDGGATAETQKRTLLWK